MDLNSMSQPQLLTKSFPGVGGRIKERPEDFEVEEIPAYEPSGSGPFLYLWVEKRDMGAEFFIRHLARKLQLGPGDIGTAGLKDRRAVTRQMVSVPESVETRLADIDDEHVRILRVSKHGNKLRPGHLHGNRFNILIRGAEKSQAFENIVQRLQYDGVPNFYGPQRFGRHGETLSLGWNVLRCEPTKRVSPFLRKLALSAVQSGLFNLYLTRRLDDGLLRKVLAGDVLGKIPFGGMFVAEDVGREQMRFDAREIVSAGPIFGRKTFPAAGEAAAREQAVLAECGLTSTSFAGFGKLMQGTRRHNLVYLEEFTTAWEEEGLRLRFRLPAGSYATNVLREIMKVEAGPEEEQL